MKKFYLIPCLVAAAALASSALADGLKIENESYRVQVDKAAGTLSVVYKHSGQNFITNACWQGGLVEAHLCAVERKPFGLGQAIEAVTPSGQVERVMLFPKVPFVLLQSVLTNATDTAVTIAKLRSLRLPLELGRMPDQLQAMGTAGLTHPAKHSGSYVFLAVADPESLRGVVAGWVSHERGDGVLFSGVENQAVYLDGQVDYGRLVLQPHRALQSELLAVGCFEDARLGLEAYADNVAKHYAIKLPRQPAGFCTWYSEKHAGACDETNLLLLANFAAKELKPFGFEFVQIDDHWQDGISTNGPKRNFMSAKPGGPYPSGMKATADGIAQLGLTPGIWFMPFAGTSYDPFFAPHQDWFYQDKDGKPFETRWGGTCLDMSVPGTRDYLKGLVHRIAHEWGYKVFKMDGLWTGTGTRLEYVNSGYKWDEMGEAAPADPDKTQIENYRDGLRLVREAAGPDVFLLGCCVSQNMRSFGGAFGLLDAMRVGPDTGAGHIGAPHASRNYFLNGRVWWNDPDCVSVRAKTPLDQARVNASFTAITGDLFYNSDWMPDLSAERLDILKRTMPAHHLPSRPVDYFENDPARIWHLSDLDRDIVALFNWGDSPTTITCAVDRIGLPAATEYVAFDFWKNRFLPPFRGEVKASLPPGSCRVLAIRPVAAHPQLLSTSRHITQGIMDVLEEKWDAATKTLSGISRVVANDPYELRVVVPVGNNSWHAVAPARQDGPNVRFAFTNATSAEVKWQIQFKRSRVEAAPLMVEETLPAPPTLTAPKERPPTPPTPSVYLDSLKPPSEKNGWGKLGTNKSIAGKPLVVDGKTYAHGLGCHANALVVYTIPVSAKRFVAVVGLDDEQKEDERSSVTFEVYGDVKEMGEAPELLAKSPVLSPKTVRSWAFNVELSERHKELRLVVTDAGDGNASDHADWVDAGFVIPAKNGAAAEGAAQATRPLVSEIAAARYAPPDTYMKDHCLIQKEGQWHLFAPLGKIGTMWRHEGSEESAEHMVSEDLIHWKYLGTAVPASKREGYFDGLMGGIAPHVIEHDGIYFMFYAGWTFRSKQPYDRQGFRTGIGVATSKDLIHWQKPEEFAKDGLGPKGSDQCVVRDESQQRWLMYLGRPGAVFVYESKDLWHWSEAGFALAHAEILGGKTGGNPGESPYVMKHPRSGKWIIFVNGGYSVSDNPLKFPKVQPYPFKAGIFLFPDHHDEGQGTFYHADDDGVGFAHEIIEFNGQWYMTGAVGTDGHTKLKLTPIAWTEDALTLAPVLVPTAGSGK